jgi:hypothetical protein
LGHLNFLAVILYREVLHGWWKVCSFLMPFVFSLQFSCLKCLFLFESVILIDVLLWFWCLRICTAVLKIDINVQVAADHFSQMSGDKAMSARSLCVSRVCSNTEINKHERTCRNWIPLSSTADVLCLPHIFLLGIQSIHFYVALSIVLGLIIYSHGNNECNKLIMDPFCSQPGKLIMFHFYR